MIPLSGLHVLNTRPAHQAVELSTALRDAGARVSELPLIEIRTLEPDAEARSLLLDLDRCDAVFFVSANAARLGLDAVAGFWPQWPLGVCVYAVGARTAAVLHDAALSVSVPAQADSEGLLAMPELQDMHGRRCLVFRGDGGRELLPETLRARGARVDVLALYRRVLPADATAQWQALHRDTPQLVILTSPDALRHWQRIAGEDALAPQWLVVSARMRAQAEAAGARVIEASGADTASIMAALSAATQSDGHLRQ